MSSDISEASPLVGDSTDNDAVIVYSESTNTDLEPKVYPVRWWILFVFFLSSTNQMMCWGLWMPLSDALLIAYDWDVSKVGMASTTTCLTFVALALPVMYLIEAKGIRVGIIIANASLVAASVLWNLSIFTQKYWLLLIGCIFSGIAPTVTYVLPSLLSVTWFPVSQRTTATSISIAGISAGMATGFIAGPYISGSHVTAEAVANRNNLTTEYVSDLRTGFQHVGYFIAGITTFVLILVIAYFPAAPPSQPSVSQTVRRTDFLPGLKKLRKSSQFWILAVTFNTPNALVLTWLPLLSVGFRSLSISEAEAALIGTWSCIVNLIALLIVSLMADRHYFKRKTKTILKILSATSILLMAVLACIQMEHIPVSNDALIPVLYVLIIGAFVCTQSTFPLYSELACDYAFPVYEGLTCTVLLMVNWATSAIFSGLLLVPALSDNTAWMTWTCVGGCVISLPLLLLLKDDFRRLDLDERQL